MGFNSTAIRFFLACAPKIGNLSSTIVLGRQSFTPTLLLLRNLKAKGLVSKSERSSYCDEFFSRTGVKKLDYLDISDYQGANILCDLGRPISSSLKEQYDLVIDAGTLEHIPDFLLALKNTMSMVKLGGFLLVVAPGNNFLGHGCYQLSPEIFQRVLSQENGFKVRLSFIHEPKIFGGKWKNVPDSKTAQSRVDITSARATYVCILAEKVSYQDGEVGHQYDYEKIWDTKPRVSKFGSFYLRSPYIVQRLLYLGILKQVYARRAKRILKSVKTVGGLRLPDIERFWIK